MSIDFTYRSYEALLRFIREELGRPIVPLRDEPTDAAFVILRHDIDYSIVKARRLAEIEHTVGARATVFVLLTSEYYNLLMTENLAALRDIAAMGHEIGLHYDTGALDGHSPEMQAAEVARLARLLEEIAGVPVTSVAQHNPSLTPVRLTIAGYRDAYDRRFCKDIAYLSDSRRLFGAPDVRRFFRDHPRSQLLVHPLWYHDRELTRRESFDAIRTANDRLVSGRLDAMNASMEEDERRFRARDAAAGN